MYGKYHSVGFLYVDVLPDVALDCWHPPVLVARTAGLEIEWIYPVFQLSNSRWSVLNLQGKDGESKAFER